MLRGYLNYFRLGVIWNEVSVVKIYFFWKISSCLRTDIVYRGIAITLLMSPVSMILGKSFSVNLRHVNIEPSKKVVRSRGKLSDYWVQSNFRSLLLLAFFLFSSTFTPPTPFRLRNGNLIAVADYPIIV